MAKVMDYTFLKYSFIYVLRIQALRPIFCIYIVKTILGGAICFRWKADLVQEEAQSQAEEKRPWLLKVSQSLGRGPWVTPWH